MEEEPPPSEPVHPSAIRNLKTEGAGGRYGGSGSSISSRSPALATICRFAANTERQREERLAAKYAFIWLRKAGTCGAIRRNKSCACVHVNMCITCMCARHAGTRTWEPWRKEEESACTGMANWLIVQPLAWREVNVTFERWGTLRGWYSIARHNCNGLVLCA